MSGALAPSTKVAMGKASMMVAASLAWLLVAGLCPAAIQIVQVQCAASNHLKCMATAWHLQTVYVLICCQCCLDLQCQMWWTQVDVQLCWVGIDCSATGSAHQPDNSLQPAEPIACICCSFGHSKIVCHSCGPSTSQQGLNCNW